MTVDEIDAELATIALQVKPLHERSNALAKERRSLVSRAFIEANGVTKDNIQMSSGEGVPWHGIITQFADWLKETGCNKRFCEWNGTIYFTAEIIAGRMDRHTSASVDDLK